MRKLVVQGIHKREWCTIDMHDEDGHTEIVEILLRREKQQRMKK